MHKQEILASEVMNTPNTQYGGREIDDVEKIEKDDKMFYNVELQSTLFNNTIVLSSEGVVEEK